MTSMNPPDRSIPLADNPYASPYALGNESPATDAEAIRRAHISHETSVRSIGSLYYLGGFLTAMLLVLVVVLTVFDEPELEAGAVGTIAILLVMLTTYFGVGRGLRKLRRSARVIAGIISTVGLLAFPFGTIINAYILYLLFSSKGNRVFSPDYQEVIEQTPHVVHRYSLVLTVLAIILLVLLLTGFVSFLMVLG